TRSLSSSTSTTLIILSMLGSVGGSQVSNSKLSSYLCAMEEAVCKLINVNNGNHTIVSSVLKDAFGMVNNTQLTESNINFSIPFSLPYEVTASNNEVSRIMEKLWNIGDYVNSVFNKDLAEIYNSSAETDYLCDPSSIEFCDTEYNLNHNADMCCKSIGSYITYPSPSTIAPTTVASNVVSSTVTELSSLASSVVDSTVTKLVTIASNTTGSTATESTTLLPTKIVPTINNTSILTIVLVVLLSLALIILAALGYKACKSKKSHNPQAVSQSDNISNHQEERENIV
ncbi:hypothetical protein, partial [Candidatus Ichthyocystis sparus]|uniref:hypothetical protein n=1 Tax=Candidatus Ichthyocystis sparus TaxID=1561004 RepID=UPI00159EC787